MLLVLVHLGSVLLDRRRIRCIRLPAFLGLNVLLGHTAIASRGCAAGSSFRWQAFRFGGADSAVANSDWTAYTKSGPPAPSPSPPPPPPQPPPPSGGSIHVADSPYGPWLPLQSPSPKCNNPSPAVHPNGTLFLACTWKLYSAPSIAGPWSDCNPRDDRCDAQEGLACDIEHNECRHAEDVAIPLFLQPEVDRLIKDAVDAAGKANDRDMAALTASKDADFAALTSAKDADVAILTASKDAEIATLTAAKDTEIAALTVAVHEKELAIVTAKANLTVCSSKLEARRLVRLANAAADLEALNNGERTDSPCAGQTDPPECDLWSTDQCGTVLFGNVNVTAECAVLCENCVPTPQEETNGAAVNGSPDIDASVIASGNRTNSTLFLAVGICAGIVVLATVINIMIRRNGANQGGGRPVQQRRRLCQPNVFRGRSRWWCRSTARLPWKQRTARRVVRRDSGARHLQRHVQCGRRRS